MSCTPGNALNACAEHASTGLPAVNLGQDGRNREPWSLTRAEFAFQEYAHLLPRLDDDGNLQFACGMRFEDVPEFCEALKRMEIKHQIKKTRGGVQLRPLPAEQFSPDELRRINAAAESCGIQFKQSSVIGISDRVIQPKNGSYLFPVSEKVIAARHRREVERAMLQGDEIPGRVLAEYPDLMKRYPQRHLSALLLEVIRNEPNAGLSVDPDGTVKVCRLPEKSEQRLSDFHEDEYKRQLEEACKRFAVDEDWHGFSIVDGKTGRMVFRTGTWNVSEARSIYREKLNSFAQKRTARAVEKFRTNEFYRLSDILTQLADPCSDDWRKHGALDEMLADDTLGPSVARLRRLRLALDGEDSATLAKLLSQANVEAQRDIVERLLVRGKDVPNEYLMRFPDLIAKYGAVNVES